MNNLWKNQLKPFIKTARSKTIGDSWREEVRPIQWYNFPFWIKYTIDEDLEHYQPKERPISTDRWKHFVFPNLKKPIFIVGSPRSGTTFLGLCIAELPEISYHFEPVLTKAAARYIYTNQWNHNQAKAFYKGVYAWLMRVHLDGDLRFAEKTPQNCFVLPFLYKAFPDARFIHIIRDGRDTSISLAKRPWYRNDMKGSGAKEPGGYPFGPKARFWVEPDRVEEFETTNDLHRCMWLWRRYLEEASAGSTQLPTDQYHELRYEDLVTNPQLESERLLDFLEITNPQSRAKFCGVVAKKAKVDSIGRWQVELSEEQQQQLEQEADEWLLRLGY
ncbi:MAG: sulfotransferase family protein [Microcoleaceae cyanobacterium]